MLPDDRWDRLIEGHSRQAKSNILQMQRERRRAKQLEMQRYRQHMMEQQQAEKDEQAALAELARLELVRIGVDRLR